MSRNNFDIIVDVRTKEEFEVGHAKSSINIPLDELEENFDKTEFAKIDKNKKIILVCRSGARAGVAEFFLKQKGFKNIENGGSWMDL